MVAVDFRRGQSPWTVTVDFRREQRVVTYQEHTGSQQDEPPDCLIPGKGRSREAASLSLRPFSLCGKTRVID